MAFLYILGAIICLLFTIYFMSKIEKVGYGKKRIDDLRKQIEETNQMLDEVQEQLNQNEQAIVKLHTISKGILSRIK